MPALLFVCVLFVLFLLFVDVLSGEPKQNQERRLADRKLVQDPPPLPRNNSIAAGRPKAPLLFGSEVILDVVCRYKIYIYM